MKLINRLKYFMVFVKTFGVVTVQLLRERA